MLKAPRFWYKKNDTYLSNSLYPLSLLFRIGTKLRNVFRAFSYNSLARLFKISIKVEFDPINNDEDAVIEDVLKRAYADNSIKLELD